MIVSIVTGRGVTLAVSKREIVSCPPPAPTSQIVLAEPNGLVSANQIPGPARFARNPGPGIHHACPAWAAAATILGRFGSLFATWHSR